MLLSRADLERLRAFPANVCGTCAGQITRDYCRDHDEFFERGHAAGCAQHSEHEPHRSYTGFAATVESGLAELAAAYAGEASSR